MERVSQFNIKAMPNETLLGHRNDFGRLELPGFKCPIETRTVFIFAHQNDFMIVPIKNDQIQFTHRVILKIEFNTAGGFINLGIATRCKLQSRQVFAMVPQLQFHSFESQGIGNHGDRT